MANLTITAADVQMTSNTSYLSKAVGEAVTAGQVLYELNTDSKAYKAEAGDTQAKAVAIGIAMMNADTIGDKVPYATSGDIYIGATLTLNTYYFLSATSGLIAPFADLVSTDWVTPLGLPKTTSILSLTINPKSFQIP